MLYFHPLLSSSVKLILNTVAGLGTFGEVEGVRKLSLRTPEYCR